MKSLVGKRVENDTKVWGNAANIDYTNPGTFSNTWGDAMSPTYYAAINSALLYVDDIRRQTLPTAQPITLMDQVLYHELRFTELVCMFMNNADRTGKRGAWVQRAVDATEARNKQQICKYYAAHFMGKK